MPLTGRSIPRLGFSWLIIRIIANPLVDCGLRFDLELVPAEAIERGQLWECPWPMKRFTRPLLRRTTENALSSLLGVRGCLENEPAMDAWLPLDQRSRPDWCNFPCPEEAFWQTPRRQGIAERRNLA